MVWLQAGRTFRVFVTSTFEDLKAERNALQERTFPRLRELCDRRGARFIDALDQFSAVHGARRLGWLPDRLPEHVRFVVSTRRVR